MPSTEHGLSPAIAAGLTAEAPTVSLVVLPGPDGRPLRVLDLLRAVPAGVAFELLLLGRREAPASEVPGVRTIAVPALTGPAAMCNAAAAAARGERVAFWDGRSRPYAQWLHALDDCLRQFGQAGMATAVLLDSAGRIAAAGAGIERDGHLVPLGRGRDPDHFAIASVEPVAAPFGGCIMVPTEVWRQFGGLDPDIGALDYAFAELGSRLRDSGFAVLRQPFARLVRDASVVGRALFDRPTGAPGPTGDAWADAFGRWRLRRQVAANGNGLASLGLAPRPAPRVLFVDSLVPTPDRDSGSGDVHCFMRIFVALGYEVTLLPANDLGRSGRYVNDLRRRGVRVVANGWARTAAEFLARERAPFDLIMLYRGSLAAKSMLDALKAHSPQARLVFNTVDLHFLRLEREALLAHAPDKLDEAFRVQQIELAAISRADCTVLLSLAERRLIADLLPRARTCVIPIPRDIPGRSTPFGPRRGVLFVGGFRHRPNVDAILAFARDVWPLIRRRLQITLMIAGADAPPDVRALDSDADGIAVLGHVDDLEDVLGRCRLTVAPLRYGAGIKGKIVSSLAAGVPCVASPIAVEGMGMADSLHVRVATLPEAFAEAVIEVHENPAMWEQLSEEGLRFATDTFSIAEARRRLCGLLAQLGLPASDPDGPGDD